MTGCYYCPYCDIHNAYAGTHDGPWCMKLNKHTWYDKESTLKECPYRLEVDLRQLEKS